MPTPQPKRAQAISKSQLAAFATKLESMSGDIKHAIGYCEESNGPICTYNYPSGIDGLTRLEKFTNALSKAVFLARTGKPLSEGELKSRSTAKKQSKKKS